MVASGATCTHSFAAHQHLSVSEIPENPLAREHTKIQVLLVRLWHSNVSAPSARKIIFKLRIFSKINVRLRRTFVLSKSLCMTQTYWWIVVHSMPRRECCGLRCLAVGPGKAVLAPQLV